MGDKYHIMVKLINRNTLSEMAFSHKRNLEDRVESFSKPINEEIIKLVVYNNLKENHNHWRERLSTYLYSVYKPVYNTNKKLKATEYSRLVFGIFGNDVDDAEVNLNSFRANNKKYPDFNITPEMCDKLYKVYNDFRELSFIFSEKIDKNPDNKKDIHYFQNYVNNVFDKYN